MNAPTDNQEVDRLLRSYFRREMPSRWPAAPGSESTVPASSAWTLPAGRALVGMSLALLVALYLGLSAFFPRERPSGLDPAGQPILGSRPLPSKAPGVAPRMP